MRQIFLDTETTGLSADKGDRIIEIGCVEMVNRKLTGNNWHHYLNPDRDSHEEALKVHGITTEFLQDKPRFENVAESFLDYVQGAQIIIHNATFDVGFLNAELARLGRPAFPLHVDSVVDTLMMAKEMFPGKRNGLNGLCDRFEIDRSSRTFHGALLDAELLADVYIHLTRGQDALQMDAGTAQESGAVNSVKADWSSMNLPVLSASEAEIAAHNDVMKQVDKESGGRGVSFPA
ncbi:MAG: hypothetical protein RIR79_479 [Pseudomonadota bacterium]|jgi:DNA polymerase-3 subunit epsilon